MHNVPMVRPMAVMRIAISNCTRTRTHSHEYQLTKSVLDFIGPDIFNVVFTTKSKLILYNIYRYAYSAPVLSGAIRFLNIKLALSITGEQ